MNYHNHHQRGFVALLSTLIISATLLVLTVGVGMASFYARSDAVAIERVAEARSLAESCVEIVLLSLATSTDAMHHSVSNQQSSLGLDAEGHPLTCITRSVTHQGNTATIDTYASSGRSFAQIRVTARLSPTIQVLSWEGQ
jgi:hypothetical protein